MSLLRRDILVAFDLILEGCILRAKNLAVRMCRASLQVGMLPHRCLNYCISRTRTQARQVVTGDELNNGHGF